MMSLDLLVNLVVAPIVFLLLMMIRERLRHSFLPRALSMRDKHTSAEQAALFTKQENV